MKRKVLYTLSLNALNKLTIIKGHVVKDFLLEQASKCTVSVEGWVSTLPKHFLLVVTQMCPQQVLNVTSDSELFSQSLIKLFLIVGLTSFCD